MNYETLLEEASKDGLYVIEDAAFKSKADGLINGDVIGINEKVRSTSKRSCILAEELGHYYTTVGNILNVKDANNRKQERRAKVWAYDKLIGLSGIISSYKFGCRSATDMAEHLEVTEDFLKEALEHYQNKYGLCTRFENYIIYFEPSIGVLELM